MVRIWKILCQIFPFIFYMHTKAYSYQGEIKLKCVSSQADLGLRGLKGDVNSKLLKLGKSLFLSLYVREHRIYDHAPEQLNVR